MKAMVATAYGSPDVLQLKEMEKPAPKENELLIKVHATTVNAGDSRMRSFTVPPLFWLPGRLALGITKLKSPVLGMELAGEVEAVGKDVTRFKVGDQVFGSTFAQNFGAHAEYKCLPEDGALAAKPSNVSHEVAATLPTGAYTALAFLERAHIEPGQKVLINGAAGSIGTFAVQLAKNLGAEVTGVCSSGNVDFVKSLGADKVIDYTREDFTQNGVIYDVIFETVGKTTFSQCKNSLKAKGYYLHTVTVSAEFEEWWHSLTTDKQFIGVIAHPHTAALERLAEMIEAGTLKAVIERCYPLEEVAEAHRYVDSGHKRGNVVIKVSNGR